MSNELTNSPLQAMRRLLKDDARYKYEAYQFVREALQFAHENLPEFASKPEISLKSDGERAEHPRGPKHITGQQLCEACRRYAVEQYGYLARLVLSSWGVSSTSDFGEIVYNLIRIEQMKKSDSDRREDFDNVYPFDGAFEPDFQMPKNTDGLGV